MVPFFDPTFILLFINNLLNDANCNIADLILLSTPRVIKIVNQNCGFWTYVWDLKRNGAGSGLLVLI